VTQIDYALGREFSAFVSLLLGIVIAGCLQDAAPPSHSLFSLDRPARNALNWSSLTVLLRIWCFCSVYLQALASPENHSLYAQCPASRANVRLRGIHPA
jgi:hypothetical protein